MTVIVYRDGVMASDGGSWAGCASHGWADKLARASDGTLYGFAGNAAEAATFITWVRNGRQGDAPALRQTDNGEQSSVIVLIAESDGTLGLLTAYGTERFAAPAYMAIGAEADVAFGALYMGATAEQAIAAACEHGDKARLPIRSIRHEG